MDSATYEEAMNSINSDLENIQSDVNDLQTTTGTDGSYFKSSTSELDPAASAAMGGMMMVMMVVYAIVFVVLIGSMWKLFTKAGKAGWAAIVPVYNSLVQLEIIGRPWWWFLLMFVPLLNIWVSIVICLDFAKAYGKSTGFGVFLILLPIIAFPMLAFSKDAKYVGPVAKNVEGLMPAPDVPRAA